MKKKILFIILGALLILALIFLLWFWFFGRHNKADVLPNNGSLGTATDVGNSGASGGSNGNGQSPIGTNTNGNATAGTGGSGSAGSGGTGAGGTAGGGTTVVNGQQPIPGSSGGGEYSYNASSTGFVSYSNPLGVTWFDGSVGNFSGSFVPSGSGNISYIPGTYTSGSTTYTGGTSGSTGGTTGGTTGGSSNNPNSFGFLQTPINDINGSTVSGSPNITTVTGADGNDIGLTVAGFGIAILGCAVNYVGERVVITPVTEGLSQVVDTIGSIITGLFGQRGASPLTPQFVEDTGVRSNTSSNEVMQCLARSIGRLAVQKITDSTVAWINSGFNGQPAYVQDFGQFFSSIADQSAGQFIQGSGLAFLCSPFQLKVKIAIAQSYANRRSSGGSTNSCTLSGVTGNIDNFLKGSFGDGGWPAFLQFTTVPANNPYAGYVEGQLALNNAISYDKQNATLTISPGGFLSQTKKVCDGPGNTQCHNVVVTPGSTIEDSLHTAFQGQLDSLQLGDSLDQILGALTNALITKVLYNGLSGASQTTASGNQPADPARTLMSSIQASVSAAQQYASIEQRSIQDIQTAENNLANVANCFAVATSTSGATATQISQGNAGFNAAVTTLTSLQTQVTALNNKITAANASIAALQSLQTDLLLATVPSDVSAIQARFAAVQSSNNPHLYTATDVTSATQDRTTLQASLAATNQTTSAQLTQCYALRQ